MEEALKVQNLSFNYGNLEILKDVSLEVSQNSIHGVVGANGAGKSTFLDVVAGYLKPKSGNINLMGKDITGESVVGRIKLGLARTFQKVELYSTLDVYDHVLLAIRQKEKLKNHKRSKLDIFKQHGPSKAEAVEVDEILEKVGLTNLKNTPVSTVSLGLSRMVELARALALDPKLILLDEPSSGLNPDETGRFTDLILNLVASSDISFLIVEHDLSVITASTRELTVLDMGKVLASGLTSEVLDDPDVKYTYLGR